MNENMEEVMLDLLCKKAVYGLTEEESKQLAELGTGTYDERSFEFTATAIGMIGLKTDEEMPAHLQARIIADADNFFAAQNAQEEVFEAPTREFKFTETNTRGSLFNWFGWAVAAAACVALAVNLYLTRPGSEIAGNPTPTPAIQELTPEQKRRQLIDSAPDLARANLGPGTVKEISGVSGDVVWSDAKQAGYVRVKGLPKNDVSRETYQLWVFEENQGDKTPIDGGTFDINADGDVIIPINAKLKAKNPKMFAVTIEKPGGVVVSDRGKIAAVAKRET